MEQLTNISGIHEDDRQELLQLVNWINEWRICGVPFVHLMHGLMMVELSGCSSLKFLISQICMTLGCARLR